MKTRTFLLVILSLPVLLLWLHVILFVSITVSGLIRIIVGFLILFLMWLLRKHKDIEYPVSFIIIFFIAGIMAQIGLGLLIESLMLILPVFFFFVLLHQYRNNIVFSFLMLTVVYVYVLLASYAVSLGLSYNAALASLSILANIGRLVVSGRIPVTVFYEPFPGLIILYSVSAIALFLLIIDTSRVKEAGSLALENAVKIFSIAVFLSLGLVYIVMFFAKIYVVVWSLVATAIFIISYLAYRLLARDTS